MDHIPIIDSQKLQAIEKIGSGSYGEVFKCLDKESGSILAVKVLESEETVLDKSTQTEIKVLKACDSPYIVKYHGCFQSLEPKAILLLMEYCGVGSVSDVLAACGSLTEEEIAAIVYCAVEGLTYLHSKRIVHRDIKAGMYNSRSMIRLQQWA